MRKYSDGERWIPSKWSGEKYIRIALIDRDTEGRLPANTEDRLPATGFLFVGKCATIIEILRRRISDDG